MRDAQQPGFKIVDLSVIRAIGAGVEQRLDKLSRLHETFTGYVGHRPPGPRRP